MSKQDVLQRLPAFIGLEARRQHSTAIEENFRRGPVAAGYDYYQVTSSVAVTPRYLNTCQSNIPTIATSRSASSTVMLPSRRAIASACFAA